MAKSSMRLKRNINFWDVKYTIDGLCIDTILNTGCINQLHLVELYFKSYEPDAKNITINLRKE